MSDWLKDATFERCQLLKEAGLEQTVQYGSWYFGPGGQGPHLCEYQQLRRVRLRIPDLSALLGFARKLVKEWAEEEKADIWGIMTWVESKEPNSYGAQAYFYWTAEQNENQYNTDAPTPWLAVYKLIEKIVKEKVK